MADATAVIRESLHRRAYVSQGTLNEDDLEKRLVLIGQLLARAFH